jgi:GT2 family glycosyltransferase
MNNHLYQAAIAPLPTATVRPQWSVMIPTYNCASYLRETLASVLMQDPGPEEMQIEVVDDCSTKDDPATVVAEVGRGRVGFFRQPHNVGHVRNFNTCLQRAQGHLIHLLHGDDSVRPGFYATMQQPFAAYPAIGAAFCRNIGFDEQGRWLDISQLVQEQSGLITNWLELIATQQRLKVCSMVVRREVYEHVRGFDQRIKYYGEDWEMWVRIAAHYKVYYEIEPLALYRVHHSSLTSHSFRTGANARDIRQVIAINSASLPASRAAQFTRTAHETFAKVTMGRAIKMLRRGETATAFVQMREALKSSYSPTVVSLGLFLVARWLLGSIRSLARSRH